MDSRPSEAPDGLSPRSLASAPPTAARPSRLPEQNASLQAVPEFAVPPSVESAAPVPPEASVNGSEPRPGQCTAPQLRRFIKSRPYVPMHELRRRFNIDGEDDDVTPVRLDPGWIYVGLPWHEGRLLGDLLRTGEIGYELSLDPRTPIVVGVYPMRPIARN